MSKGHGKKSKKENTRPTVLMCQALLSNSITIFTLISISTSWLWGWPSQLWG